MCPTRSRCWRRPAACSGRAAWSTSSCPTATAPPRRDRAGGVLRRAPARVLAGVAGAAGPARRPAAAPRRAPARAQHQVHDLRLLRAPVSARVGAVVAARMSSARLPGQGARPAGRAARAGLGARAAGARRGARRRGGGHLGERRRRPRRRLLRRARRRAATAARSRTWPRACSARPRRTASTPCARVNGDSPLIDQRLVDRGVALLRAGGRRPGHQRPPAHVPAGPVGRGGAHRRARARAPRRSRPTRSAST